MSEIYDRREIRVHPGYLFLLRARMENDSWDMEEYARFDGLVQGASSVSMVDQKFDREEDYGILEMFVLEDQTGRRYGQVFYRGLGKHDDYDEFYLENPNDPDLTEEDWVAFARVDKVLDYRYEWSDAND